MKQLPVKYNKIIPFPGYFAINLFGTMFVREEYKHISINWRIMNHDGIHTLQALDFVGGNEKLQALGYCIFYILYFIEWIIKLIPSIVTFGWIKAYQSISFEQEAYKYQSDENYQSGRKKFAWIKYIFKFIK